MRTFANEPVGIGSGQVGTAVVVAILLNCRDAANYSGELTQVLVFVWLINRRLGQLAKKVPQKTAQELAV